MSSSFRFLTHALTSLIFVFPASAASIQLLAPPTAQQLPAGLSGTNYTNSQGNSINNNGQIAVTLFTSGGGASSALYTDGTFTSIQGTATGPTKRSATDINNSGAISGTFFTGTAKTSGFSVQNDTVVNLKDLSSGSTYRGSQTYAINDTGIVVGESYTSGNSHIHAVVWVGGTSASPAAPTASTNAVDLTPSGNYDSYAYDINSPSDPSKYEIVGTANNKAFKYTKTGGLTFLTTTVSDAYSVNNAGLITGDMADSSGDNFIAYLYDPSGGGSFTSLGTLAGTSNSAGNSINSLGQIVGDSYNLNAAGSAVLDQTAFLYSNGQMIDLNSLLPANSGWHLEYAAAINDLDQIVGTGTFNGVEQGFLLDTVDSTQTPEPGTILLLTSGIALAVFGRRLSVRRV